MNETVFKEFYLGCQMNSSAIEKKYNINFEGDFQEDNDNSKFLEKVIQKLNEEGL